VGGEGWSKGKALLVLVGAAAAIGWLSELLVGAVQEAGEALGMTEAFLGVVVIALIGNAAEHSTAVLMALKNKMDLALHIAIGSSIQIALFVAPLLVFLSYVIGPAPMDLHFTSLEVLAVALSVLIISQVADDGKSHWMEGVQLVAVYAILALAFFHLPA
jgi:Ca2+:H+ antiporter